MSSNNICKSFWIEDQTTCTHMPPSHHCPYTLSHLCSFPRESPTVFFTSSFPGFSTCSFKPANPPKGIFLSVFVFFLLFNLERALKPPTHFVLKRVKKKEKSQNYKLLFILSKLWHRGGWLHLSVVPRVPQR